MKAPVLIPCNYENEVSIETDMTKYVSACLIFKYGNKGVLHPVGNCSKKNIQWNAIIIDMIMS